jgi:hypothetical protein
MAATKADKRVPLRAEK